MNFTQLENEEILGSFIFILYLLNSSNKTVKKYWKMERKHWKSQGKVMEICQSENVGTMCIDYEKNGLLTVIE